MEELSTSLKKVAKGTGFIFIGTIIGLILSCAFRILVVRYITSTEYGLLSLALVIINIVVVFATLGFDTSVPRYISFALSIKDYKKAWGIIITALKIAIFLSIFFSIILFIIAPNMAKLFKKMDLITPFHILVYTIPLIVLTNILISVMRGIEDINARIYFTYILPFFIKIIILLFVILIGLSFKGVLYTYVFGFLLTLIILIFYMQRELFKTIPASSYARQPLAKELIKFSIPLLFTNVSTLIMGWTDTIMLGYFKSSEIVGLYNGALPLSRFIQVPLGALNYLYLPVASKYFANERFSELKRLYSCIAKWTFFFTLPIILFMLLGAKTILHLFFGYEYIKASSALKILVIAEFIHVLLGPNGVTMISLGKIYLVLLSTLFSAIVNIILNLAFIPKYGMVGAAFASASSLAIGNILFTSYLYKITRIHPFTKNYLKPVGFVFFSTCILLLIKRYLIDINVFLIVVIVLCLFLLFILANKCIDQEDILLLSAIEQKIFKRRKMADKLAKWCNVMDETKKLKMADKQ